MSRQTSDSSFSEQLYAARSAGGWIPWACTTLALAWWGGAAAYVLGKYGLDTIMAMPWAELGGAFGLAFAPGMALIMAGFMGRESVRASRSNALVLQASNQLMSPARESADDIRTLSDAIRLATGEVNDRLSETEARIDTLKSDMEISANAALKAAEIVRADAEALRSKLATERDGFASLSDDLRRQIETISDALPKHAEKLTRSAEMAHEDMAKAGAQLDGRLNQIEETGKALSQRVAQLDQMTADTRKRAQNLVTALVSINEQMQNSSRMVDNSVKAGELAVEASKGTANAIKDAMDSALDGGRDMVERLTAQAQSAKTLAQQAVDRLNETATAAEGSINRAMDAANQQADAAERRMDQLSVHMFESANRATEAAEAGLDRARSRIEKATTLLSGLDEDVPVVAPQPATRPTTRIVTPQRPDHNQASNAQTPVAAAKPDVDQTARASGSGAGGIQGLDEDILAPEPAPTPQPSSNNRLSISSLMPFDPLEEEDQDDYMQTVSSASAQTTSDTPNKPVASSEAPNGVDDGMSDDTPHPMDIGMGDPDKMTWRDLLSNIDEPDARHETALAFVDQLGRHGIRLKRAIRSADLRRIASAANRGDRQRRRATQQAAPGELQQIERLLRQDKDLRIAAESYLAIEEPDALRVLSNAGRAKDDAGPRLAAFLLLDTAMGA